MLTSKGDFSKIRSSKLASIFVRFWCQHASILPPKIHQNPSKNRFQDASFFRSIFASIFLRFCFDLGGQLGAMLATFSLKIRRPNLTPGSFMLGLSFFSVFGASWPPLGALWARFGKVRASILEVFGAHFLHIFQFFLISGSQAAQRGNQNTRQAGKQTTRQPGHRHNPTRHPRLVS